MRRMIVVLSSLLFLVSTVSAQEVEITPVFEPDVPASEDTVGEETAEVGVEAEVAAEPETTSSLEHTVGRAATLTGPTGLFHLLTADSTASGTFSVGLFGEFFSAVNVVRDGDDNSRFIGRLTLSYTPIEFLEVFASLSGHGNANSHADPVLIQSLGDFILGAKGFYGFDNGFSTGGAVALRVLNAQNSVGLDFSATSVDIRALFGYSLQDTIDVPLELHANLGVFVDNSPELFSTDDGGILELQRVERFAHGVSDYHLFEIGLGVEVPLPWVTPFLEWNLGIPVGSDELNDCATSLIPCPRDVGFSSFPDILTIGFKGSPLPQLVLNLGVDIGLTADEATGVPAVPPYDVLFGVSYIVDPSGSSAEPEIVYVEDPTLNPPLGWILGEVVVGETNDPISGAVITYPGTEYTPQSTDDTTGRFRSYEFPVGTEISVDISHPSFESRSFTRAIIEGQDGIRIRLQPGNIGMLTGRIAGPSGDALPATVFLRGAGELQFEVDPLTGEFSEQVEIGEYTVTVVADGHVSDRQQIDIAGQITHSPVLDSLPEEQAAVLRGDRIHLSGERIRFEDNEDELEPASEELLDQVAELLLQYPDINIQVGAHTDDRGSVELTEAQAQAVADHLIERGVDPERVEAVGLGSDRPLFPNISNRNRERNRRVELLFRD